MEQALSLRLRLTLYRIHIGICASLGNTEEKVLNWGNGQVVVRSDAEKGVMLLIKIFFRMMILCYSPIKGFNVYLHLFAAFSVCSAVAAHYQYNYRSMHWHDRLEIICGVCSSLLFHANYGHCPESDSWRRKHKIFDRMEPFDFRADCWGGIISHVTRLSLATQRYQ